MFHVYDVYKNTVNYIIHDASQHTCSYENNYVNINYNLLALYGLELFLQ